MDHRKEKRVTRPELKALIAFINRYTKETGRALVFVHVPAEKQVVFIECHGDRYYSTHVFDRPKEAKKFLIEIMNKLTIKHGVLHQ